jgi:hypothetical protein
VLLISHREIPAFSDAVEAEALACLEGIKAAVQWVHMRIILETDTSEKPVALFLG